MSGEKLLAVVMDRTPCVYHIGYRLFVPAIQVNGVPEASTVE